MTRLDSRRPNYQVQVNDGAASRVEAIDVGAVSLKQLLIYASLVSLRNLTWPAIELVETNTKVLRHGLARCSDTQDQLYTKDNAFVETGGSFPLIHCIQLALSRALQDRYQHSYRVADLDEVIGLCRTIVASCPSWSTALSQLAVALRLRAYHLGCLDDLSGIVSLQRTALSLTGLKQLGYDDISSELALTLAMFHRELDIKDGSAESIVLQRQALIMRPPGHPSRHESLYRLSIPILLRFFQGLDTDGLSEAKELLDEVVRARPPGHRDRHSALSRLSQAHMALFHLHERLEDCDQAIALAREAVSIAPDAHPDCRKYMVDLCGYLSDRFPHDQSTQLLAEAVSYGRQAVRLYPSEHHFRIYALNNLGVALSQQHKHDEMSVDLQEIIRIMREVLDYRRTKNMADPYAILNLANFLTKQYKATMDLEYLFESIQLGRSAIELSPPGSNTSTKAICDLSEALILRYNLSGDPQDLDQMIRLHSGWAETESTTPEYDISRRMTLADGLHRRYLPLRRIDDLDGSIALMQGVFAELHASHELNFQVTTSLTRFLCLRFRSHGSVDDVREAYEIALHRLGLTPTEDPHKALYRLALANVCLCNDGPFFDFHRALGLLAEAVDDPYCVTRDLLSHAIEVLSIAEHSAAQANFTSQMRSLLLEMYTRLMALLPNLAYLGLDVLSRLRVLKLAEGLADRAVTHALLLTQPSKALELSEAGRAVFWRQSLKLRGTFSGDSLSEYATSELKNIAQELERQLPTEGRAADCSVADRRKYEEALAKKRRLGLRFQQLLDETTHSPSKINALASLTSQVLAKAAARGPVILYFASADTCQALILHNSEGACEQVVLPKATLASLKDVLSNLKHSVFSSRLSLDTARGMRKRALTAQTTRKDPFHELWSIYVSPVVQALGLERRTGRARPRVFICATGIFNLLPLHAARHTSESHNSLSSYCVPSYVPTLETLIRLRNSVRPVKVQDLAALLVAVPKAQGHKPLPYAMEETGEIHRALVDVTEQVPQHANQGAPVLDGLLQASIAHFACHGSQQSGRALQGGFMLDDGMLTVERLISLRLPNAIFAFLSACETAKGDDQQLDEVVHLAATMLFVGFKSVIGTMWSMHDVDGPRVARMVYSNILKGDADGNLCTDAIPYAWDAAVSELRDSGICPTRWAPYVHLGI